MMDVKYIDPICNQLYYFDMVDVQRSSPGGRVELQANGGRKILP